MSVVSTPGSIRGKSKKENQDSYAVIPNFQGVEGAAFIMVCDGHGESGHLISRYITQHISDNLNNLRVNPNRDFEDSFKGMLRTEVVNAHWEVANTEKFNCEKSGSTLTAAALHENTLICANVGDSRAVLIYTDKGEWVAKQLTIDHKPDVAKERERIEANYGRVQAYLDSSGSSMGPARVWLLTEDTPGLAMSRSIGDTLAHSVGVSETPDISLHYMLPEDKAIVMASDGLWDVVSNAVVSTTVAHHYQSGNFDTCGQALVKLAESLWKRSGDSVDDITVIVLWLRHAI